MWDRGFWSRRRREEDALSARRSLADMAIDTLDRQGGVNEKWGKVRGDREEGYAAAGDARRSTREREADERRFAEAAAADERTGRVASGDMIRRQAELDAAGHGERLSRAPRIARSAAEREAVASDRLLADEVFGQSNDPTVRQAKLEASLAGLGALKNKGLFEKDYPGAQTMIPLVQSLLDAQTRQDVAAKALQAKTVDMGNGLSTGSTKTQPMVAPERIELRPKEEDKGVEGGMGMDLSGIMKMLQGFGGGGGM